MEDIHSNFFFISMRILLHLCKYLFKKTFYDGVYWFLQSRRNKWRNYWRRRTDVAKIAKKETEDRKPKSKHDTKIFFNEKTLSSVLRSSILLRTKGQWSNKHHCNPVVTKISIIITGVFKIVPRISPTKFLI